VIQGNVFDVLPTIAPGSIDVCVTSPPYWNLRSYLAKGHPLKRFELGNEKTPAEYVANMVRVFSLVRECMADHATCWLNVGDSYSHDSRGGETGGKHVDWCGAG
jgi:DNA modification methylase